MSEMAKEHSWTDDETQARYKVALHNGEACAQREDGKTWDNLMDGPAIDRQVLRLAHALARRGAK